MNSWSIKMLMTGQLKCEWVVFLNIITHTCIFEEHKPDFAENLLAFYNHPYYQSLDSEKKNKILSGAWINYNQKTISLELEVVNPICNEIILKNIIGLNQPIIRNISSQIMIDEAFHVLLVSNSNTLVNKYRNLDIQLRSMNFIRSMKMEQERHSEY